MAALDKLSTVQDACELTGDNAPQVADDGSEEWIKGSIAWERALPYALEGKNWKFSTKVEVLTASPTAPSDPLFDTAYAKPPDLLHLIWVRLNDLTKDYQILDNQIILNNPGKLAVTAKYVYAATPDQFTPTFGMAMLAFTMSGIYRGLHENITEADKQWMLGEQLLSNAATRSDQEQGKRAVFNSRLSMARRTRKPWIQPPLSWTGTNRP